MAFDNIFQGPPEDTVAPGTPQSPSLGVDVVNNELYISSGNGWEELSTGGGGSVTKLIAGSNITLSPTGGTGDVTINSVGGAAPIVTNDASTVPNYAQGVAILNLNTAELLSFDGTIGTAITAVLSPGAGREIQPGKVVVEYMAGSHAFSSSANIEGAYGSNEFQLGNLAMNFASASSLLSAQVGGFSFENLSLASVVNSPFSIYLDTAINGGAIATSSVASGGHGYAPTDTGTVNGGNATYTVNTVSAGNGAIVSVNPTPAAAGLGYANGDTGTLTHGSGTAAYVVDSVGTTGGISAVTIASGGTGHAVGDYLSAISPSGNAALRVQSVDGGGAVLSVSTTAGLSIPGSDYSIASGTSAPISSAVLTSILGSGGSGYAAGDTGFFGANLPTLSAAYMVDTVDGSGAVLTYHVTDPGYGNFVQIENTQNGGSQPGSGSGFTINVLSVSPTTSDVSINITAVDVGVVAFHLTNNGTGYSIESNSPTATGGSQPGTGTGFQISITDVNSGIVTGFTVTDATPDTYSVGTGIGTAVTSGSGDGTLTLDINSITQGNGSAQLTIYYTVVPLL